MQHNQATAGLAAMMRTRGAAAAATDARTASPAPLLFFWALALLLSPIMVLAPGNPQPPDAAYVALVALSFTGYFAPLRYDAVILVLGGLWLLDVLVVNASWWVITSQRDERFLWATLYHCYNGLIMVTVASLLAIEPDGARRWARWALLLALAFEVAATLLNVGARNSGSFQNPNDFGYWSLLIATIWFALKPREPLRPIDLIVLGITAFLCFSSASRSAMLGAGILVATALIWHRPSGRMVPAVAVCVVAAGIVAVATIDQWLPGLVENSAVRRFEQVREHDSWAGRGYDRIGLFLAWFIFGAGEGAFQRFALWSQGGSLETHSTFATVLVSYGVVGTLLLGGILWRIFRGAGMRFVALAMPAAMYGLAHNGMRDPRLWVFLGIALAERWRSR